MNAEQRTQVTAVVQEIGIARGKLEELRDEIQNDFEELSEKAQDGPRGEAMQEDIAKLEETVAGLEQAEDVL